jgi:hypothetical protein
VVVLIEILACRAVLFDRPAWRVFTGADAEGACVAKEWKKLLKE